jgi:pSer/pThr/pTyr-binding forkhead associated (FHA) protein
MGSAISEPTTALPFSEFDNRPLPIPVDFQALDPPEKPKQILFVIPGSRRRIELKLKHQIRIGRADPQANITPELDLTQDQGIENGISRLHATIQLAKQGVILMDLDSTNGTTLNKTRLPAQKPFLLKSGDEIKFGDLLVHIFFD